MTSAPFIVIDGKRYRWKDIIEMRRVQLAAAKSPASQPMLFETLRADHRPANARTASDRYQQPSLFAGEFQPIQTGA
jgi:hypothetical protein